MEMLSIWKNADLISIFMDQVIKTLSQIVYLRTLKKVLPPFLYVWKQ